MPAFLILVSVIFAIWHLADCKPGLIHTSPLQPSSPLPSPFLCFFFNINLFSCFSHFQPVLTWFLKLSESLMPFLVEHFAQLYSLHHIPSPSLAFSFDVSLLFLLFLKYMFQLFLSHDIFILSKLNIIFQKVCVDFLWLSALSYILASIIFSASLSDHSERCIILSWVCSRGTLP